ncbi:hypothetical protein IQ244_04790 [Nostoc sp. LEGE 06077]|uniref:hypothetical protein n=1 Tax=Nostoc sp. LEGE 06077 TaxID=915325 RepID=UPI001880CC3B|nr:hypothetical protein [Nostoc sp. LEGE 06077]MBE9205840.1 hypothetical protein [Nostoc sp. LEGE 06077]
MFTKKSIYTPAYILISSLMILLYFTEPSFASQNQNSTNSLSTKERIDTIISILGTSFALFTLWRGIEQYRKDKKWKKAELVAKEMKEFKSDPVIKNVMLMLDWNRRKINLSQEVSIFNIDVELCKALQAKTYMNEPKGFTPAETLLRDHFDVFLDYLERFESFIETGLVSKEDFYPYLNYWFNIIGNKQSERKSLEFYEILWQYIDFFGYIKVQKLMSRYGYCIKPNT